MWTTVGVFDDQRGQVPFVPSRWKTWEGHSLLQTRLLEKVNGAKPWTQILDERKARLLGHGLSIERQRTFSMLKFSLHQIFGKAMRGPRNSELVRHHGPGEGMIVEVC